MADTPRPLPMSLIPQAGESLSGYVLALSHHLGVTPGDVCQRTGLADGAAYARSAYNARLDAPTRTTFARATGLAEGQVAGMLLSSYRGVLYDDAANNSGRFRPETLCWSWPSRSRVCPACLNGSLEQHGTAVWQTLWRTGWALSCIRHQVLLVDTCTEGHLIGETGNTASNPLVPNPAGDAPTGTCRWRVASDRLCGKGYDDTQAATATHGLAGCDLSDVLALQARLDAVLAPGEGGEAPALTSLGSRVDPAQYFRDLRAVATLAAMLDLDTRTDNSAAGSYPGTEKKRVHAAPLDRAADQASVLVAAVRSLDLGPDDGTKVISDLAQRGHAANPVLTNKLRFNTVLSPLVRGALSNTRRNMLSAQRLRLAAGLDGPVPTLQVAAVPGLLALRDYQANFAWIQTQSLLVRRSVPVTVITMLTGCTLTAAADTLMLPPGGAAARHTRLLRVLKAQGGVTRFRNEVVALANGWSEQSDRPDYAARRAALNGWELDEARFRDFVAKHRLANPVGGFRKGNVEARRLQISVYLWAAMTGGDSAAHPLVIASSSNPERKTRLSERLPALTSVTTSLTRDLDRLAATLLAELEL